MTATPSLSHPSIRSPRLKLGLFALVFMTALATTFFFYDFYFFTREKFGFHERQNLLLAASLGGIYCFASLAAGRFAQRFGYFFGIRFGLGTMIVAMLAASLTEPRTWPTLALVAVANVGMCFCWPPMEALLSEGEPPMRLQNLVGHYSCAWAGASACAYFSGGAILDHFGLRSIFFVPVGIFAVVWVFLAWFERQILAQPQAGPKVEHPPLHAIAKGLASPIPPVMFLKMAWLANPMVYLVVNTLVSVIPTLAADYKFTPTMAGIVCSIWLFARAGSFVLLRMWPRWHYRFRFLAIGYVAMIGSFATMLIVHNLWALMISQLVIGVTLGLMYYSSLFYAMDVGETKGEHGGIHEAAIGLGSGAGPGIAALSLWMFPQYRQSAAVGVCGLLICGLIAMFTMRYGRARR